MSGVIQILAAEQAQATILRREPPDEVGNTPQINQRILELFGESLTPEEVVAKIISEVRAEGDAALEKYSKLLDGASLTAFKVDSDEIGEAYTTAPDDLIESLKTSAERIRSFHEQQPLGPWMNWNDEGGLGQMVRPLERVGLYVPGGTAPLASSLLMTAVPARVAGVEEIIVATPPGPDGRVNGTILAAAHIAGVDAVYQVGGVQAIAAMAYGTASIPKVDKILGPGNLFVVLAKRQVYGVVDIDLLPGPTETVVIADDSARPDLVAADLLAQAEHDPLASAILITTSPGLAEKVCLEVEDRVASLDRSDIIRASLHGSGGIVLTDTVEHALQMANDYAPEHLCLLVRDPWSFLGKVKHAGGVFVGEHSSEALGDYVTGPSHVMPTGGTARFSSPINLRDFTKVISVFGVNKRAHDSLAASAITLAEAEGLTAHAAAIRARQNPTPNGGKIDA
ncbi:MAG: histidinol dehydrogenase [Candidatus Latescibacteria bacterium]|nr:histidinol dehydrogenase [Candidatus Latescibacterota bacterium]